MVKLLDLKNAHKGRPAAVLGGGPSLPGDLEKIPPGCVMIAVNEHPFYIGVTKPDYLVFMDDPVHNPLLYQVVKDCEGVRVTHNLRYTDVNMAGVEYWNGPGSGIVACWLGCWLGCDPVILCGFDLYQGEQKYCHREEMYEDRPVFDLSFDEHLNRWKAGFRRCPGIERVRAASGPLAELFGVYTMYIQPIS